MAGDGGILVEKKRVYSEVIRKYRHSKKYKETEKKYRDTEKYKQTQKEYYARTGEVHRARMREYHAENKEKVSARHKKRYNEHPFYTFKEKLQDWTSEARRKKMVWELTLGELEAMPLVCAYTGEVLTLERNKLNIVSVDRIDSNKGYTKDNVVFCCSIINIMKTYLTVAEFRDWCTKVANYKGEV